MMSFLTKYADILIIIALSVFTVLPLFTPGFFPMHDDEQIGRLYDLNKDVMTGQLPPRLAQDLGFGFDYPLFNFYPSFVYYVAEVFHLFGFSFITSTKLMIGLGFLLAGIFMYFFSKQYLGRVGGIVAAIGYTYVPYHAVDVYVRGALPEFWSFVFVPAVFWSFYKLAITGKSRYIYISAILVACLVTTHDLIAMMSSIFLGTYFLFLIFHSKKRAALFGKICLSFALGMAFSAYFWIPSYFEKQYTMVNLLTTQLADYHLYFVCIRQFAFSPWGYGGSVPGCSDGLSFQIGQAQLVLGALSVLFSLFLLWRKKKKFSLLLLFGCMFLFSLFIQTKYSVAIWDKLPSFEYIQFPWRFLIFSDFTIAFLAAYIVSLVQRRKLKMFLAGVMILIIIFMNKGFFAPEKYLRNVTDSSYTAASVIRWHTSLLSFEYSPIGIATKLSNSGNSIIDIRQDQVPTKGYQVIQGKITVKQVQDIPQQKEFLVNARESSIVRLNTFTFPGWKTYIDGKEVSYSDKNKLRLITLSIPKGEHMIRAILTDTPMRAFSNGLSVATIIGVIVFELLRKKKYGKN
ncbi:MAG TPA: 6-pyruvoyl-tetrahydropterin synthase-related protein [Candidatus Saccharimonadales bacterium]|nr:6-pyruvoyl-tetrahydropterin synthase-related protein [Candidatus Saccharimonadales bacterium]